jgi:hypothetical protein
MADKILKIKTEKSNLKKKKKICPGLNWKLPAAAADK